jgi:hypothetical protein
LVNLPYIDTAKALQDEEIHFGEYMIHVRWNPYMSSHEADLFKIKSVGTKQTFVLIGTGAGKSKDKAVEDAKKLI